MLPVCFNKRFPLEDGREFWHDLPVMPKPSDPADDQPDSCRHTGAPTESKRLTPVLLPRELGGTGGPEPTRFGDWEKQGRCIDF